MRSRLLASTLFSLALLPLVLPAPLLYAQEAPSPSGPPPASDAPPVPQNDTDAPTLNVNVNLVEPLFLRARQGRLYHQPGQERLQPAGG